MAGIGARLVRRLPWGATGALVITQLMAFAPPAATATLVTQNVSFRADDGVVLHAAIGGIGGIAPRPLIIEDSPYAPACCNPFAGAAYNYIVLHWRGTGQSQGSFSSTGPRDQQDLREFLGWACQQPWSNGSIGLYGFSASAIVAYNSMHLGLPCVKAAAMMSGTVDLYRDLLYIGGINNTVPGLVVEGQILSGWPQSLGARLKSAPPSIPASLAAFPSTTLDVARHSTEDAYWLDRSFQGFQSHQGIPILADDGFYDVESRGAFMTYQATKQYGSHLLVIGAHDGFAGGTAGPFPQYARWFDHYVRGVANGIDAEPAVSAYLSNGSHLAGIDGQFTQLTGSSWPLPGTQWTRLYLSPAKSGSARSLNDGSLTTSPAAHAVQAYPFVPSDGLETDAHTVSTVSGAGFGPLTLDNGSRYFPFLTDMQLSEPLSLSYTTPPLTTAVNAVGPVGLDVFAKSTAMFTDIVAVLADVWPDGSAHPVAQGQLRTAYPHIDSAQSLFDGADVIQPYTDFSSRDLAAAGATREYHVEVLPIGNHFAAGHRLRLYFVGTSGAMQGATPGVDYLSIGGITPSRLLLPIVPSA